MCNSLSFVFFLISPHKLKKFNVGEGRYHITTATRELSPVVTGVGMALGGEEESAGQGFKLLVTLIGVFIK